MRYEELPEPFQGWSYDETGTIYTSSGYRCSAKILESALWLFQCYSGNARQHLIRSDEQAGALRPLYELSDLSATVEPTRFQSRSRRSGKSGGGHMAPSPATRTDRLPE